MLKREDITEELMEKYKEKKPKSLKDFFDKYNGFNLITERFKLIEALMNFYYPFNYLKGENIKKGETEYTILTVSDIYKKRIITDITDVLLKYSLFQNSVLKKLSERLIYFEFTEIFSKDDKIYFKFPNFLNPFLFKENNIGKIDYNKEVKKIILDIVGKLSNNNFLIEENEENIPFRKVNNVSFELKDVFFDILRLIFLFGIKLEEIYNEILIEEILKIENSGEIKRHKILKYSQVDLNIREILKDFLLNKTSKQNIKSLYPNFDEWFDKVLKEIEEDNTKREILFFENIDGNGLQIDGIAILKNTEEEKKICYLYISLFEDIDNIFEEIYNYLGTETPLITVEKEIFENRYKYILKPLNEEVGKRRKLKFDLTSVVPDKYVKGKTELIFNEVGKEPIDLKGKSLDEVIKEIIEENLKKKEEIVETVETINEEMKENVQK